PDLVSGLFLGGGWWHEKLCERTQENKKALKNEKRSFSGKAPAPSAVVTNPPFSTTYQTSCLVFFLVGDGGTRSSVKERKKTKSFEKRKAFF
ncbi:MAG: hypothetical protein IKT56_01885, partial [Clostridia bacterium]|nr:hypothetical protein [Clostridia bacterium]